ncbi:MAG: GerAB/ArcD/ProY family transporter, partial [Bacillota bacterium]
MTKSISSRQAAFLVLNSMIGVGILSLPRTLITDAHQHAWVPVLLGGAIPMVGLWLQVRLCKRFPKLDFVRINRRLLGGVLGSILPIAFVLYGASVVATVSRNFSDMIMTMLFLRTPKSMLVFILLATAAYTVQFGARVMARLNELLFYLVLPINLLLLPALQAAQVTNLLPLGEMDLLTVAAATLKTAYAYLGFEILMFFYWQVEEQEQVLRYSWWATLYVILQYTLVIVVTLLVLGLELVRRFNYPSLAVLRVADIPVFERMELLFVIFYTALVFRPVTNYYLLVSETICRLWGGRGMRVSPWLLLIPFTLLALWPPNA